MLILKRSILPPNGLNMDCQNAFYFVYRCKKTKTRKTDLRRMYIGYSLKLYWTNIWIPFEWLLDACAFCRILNPSISSYLFISTWMILFHVSFVADKIPARTVLTVACFFAALTCYLTRVNLSMAIVAMVKESRDTYNRTDYCEGVTDSSMEEEVEQEEEEVSTLLLFQLCASIAKRSDECGRLPSYHKWVSRDMRDHWKI